MNPLLRTPLPPKFRVDTELCNLPTYTRAATTTTISVLYCYLSNCFIIYFLNWSIPTVAPIWPTLVRLHRKYAIYIYSANYAPADPLFSGAPTQSVQGPPSNESTSHHDHYCSTLNPLPESLHFFPALTHQMPNIINSLIFLTLHLAPFHLNTPGQRFTIPRPFSKRKPQN